MDFKKGNWKINKFMGFNPEEFEKRSQAGLQYHSSWDWLMPVVNKIKNIDTNTNESFRKSILLYIRNEYTIYDLNIFQDISTVYEKVIEFIDWYNKTS